VVLVVISHPRGEKGGLPLCTYGRFACCRARSFHLYRVTWTSDRGRSRRGHRNKNRKPPLIAAALNQRVGRDFRACFDANRSY